MKIKNELRVYRSWKSLIKEWDFSYWRRSSPEDSVCKVSIEDFKTEFEHLLPIEIGYPFDLKGYLCTFDHDQFLLFEEEEDDIEEFYVVFLGRRCYGKAFFSKEEAERFLQEMTE